MDTSEYKEFERLAQKLKVPPEAIRKAMPEARKAHRLELVAANSDFSLLLLSKAEFRSKLTLAEKISLCYTMEALYAATLLHQKILAAENEEVALSK